MGCRVGRKRVARLIRAAGLVGVSKTGAAPRSKRTVPESPQAPDLVKRDFRAPAPNALWVADITYVPTYAGFLYLAVVLDAFSRCVVGWAMSSTRKAGVVLDALQMATTQRPSPRTPRHASRCSAGSRGGMTSTAASPLGQRSPAAFERAYVASATPPAAPVAA